MMIAIMLLVQAFMQNVERPVVLTPERTERAPTLAARAVTLEAIGPVPAEPVTMTIQCVVYAKDGDLGNCAPAEDGGTKDRTVFFNHNLVLSTRTDLTATYFNAAILRAKYYKVRPFAHAGSALPTVLIRETFSRADQPTLAPATEPPVKARDLRIDASASVPPTDFYPLAGLRDRISARARATCRVLEDGSFLCRDVTVSASPEKGSLSKDAEQSLQRAFAEATRRAFAGMRAGPETVAGEKSAGRETTLAMNWTLP